MEKIRLITVRSEIAANKRGVGLGVDAMIIASLEKNSQFFKNYGSISVDDVNNLLFTNDEYLTAKHIDGVVTMLNRVASTTLDVIREGFFPLVLAGDHSTAAGTISGIKKAFPKKRLGVVWIDAHADFHSPYTTPSGNMHGMPLAIVTNTDNIENRVNSPKESTLMLWEKAKDVAIPGPKINHSDIVYIAVRDMEPAEKHIVDKFGITNFTPQQIHEQGGASIARQALEVLKDCDLIYISFDVDSLDPAISAGTGTPVNGGITLEEAMEINTALVRDPRVCGWEIVEVNPTLDSQNIMAKNAFEIIQGTVKTLESAKELVHS